MKSNIISGIKQGQLSPQAFANVLSSYRQELAAIDVNEPNNASKINDLRMSIAFCVNFLKHFEKIKNETTNI